MLQTNNTGVRSQCLRTALALITMSSLQNTCCGCTGEQLQTSAQGSSVPSSRRQNTNGRLQASAPTEGGRVGFTDLS